MNKILIDTLEKFVIEAVLTGKFNAEVDESNEILKQRRRTKIEEEIEVINKFTNRKTQDDTEKKSDKISKQTDKINRLLDLNNQIYEKHEDLEDSTNKILNIVKQIKNNEIIRICNPRNDDIYKFLDKNSIVIDESQDFRDDFEVATDTQSSKFISKKINEIFCHIKYGDIDIIIDNNGYINATKFCKNAMKEIGSKKPFRNWIANDTAKEAINILSELKNISEDKLLITVTGGQTPEIRGTYVHPMLITYIAYWISPKFAMKTCIWIEEWKKYSNENATEYYNSLFNLNPSNNLCREKEIQKKLQKKYGGEIEVETVLGDIDLLTDELLIEIKTYKNWKYALGQLNAYSIAYPDRKKYMYLFDVNGQKTSHIENICKQYDIKVIVYDE